MPDKKLSELDEIEILGDTDLLAVSKNNGDGTFTSNKIKNQNVRDIKEKASTFLSKDHNKPLILNISENGTFGHTTLDSKNNSLIASYPLNEESGQRNDIKGTNNLTDNNTVGFIDDATFGKVADFERDNNETLQNSSVDLFNNAESVFISQWIKLETLGVYHILMFEGTSSVGYGRFNLTINTLNKISIEMRDTNSGNSGTSKQLISNFTCALDVWYHICVFIDTSLDIIQLFINESNVENLSVTMSNFMDNISAEGLTFGNYPNTENIYAFDGQMHNVNIWKNITFTDDAEILNFAQLLYNGGNGRFYTDTTVKDYRVGEWSNPGTRSQTSMVLIDTIEVTENTTSVEFNGLDGDKDIEYEIKSNINSNAVCSFGLTLNNDTASNYPYQYLMADGTTTLSGTNMSTHMINCRARSMNTKTVGSTILQAITNGNRTATTDRLDNDSETDLIYLKLYQKWLNDTDNITSIQLTSTVALGIGIGSRIELWAHREIGAVYGGDIVIENNSFTEIKTDRDYEESVGQFRPIYTKTIDIGNLPNATTKPIDHNIDNISTITKQHGWFLTDNYNPLPYTHPTSSYNIMLRVSTTQITTHSAYNWSSYTGTVTLEYTKITDTATSLPRVDKLGGALSPTNELEEGENIDTSSSFVRTYNNDTQREEKVSLDNLKSDMGNTEYLNLILSENQTSLVDGGNIKFIKGADCKGNIDFDDITHRATLKAGQSYELFCSIRSHHSSAGYIDFVLYDITNNIELSSSAVSISPSHTTNTSIKPMMSCITTPITDILVEIRVLSSSNFNDIISNSSFLTIKNITKTSGGNFTKDTGLLSVYQNTPQAVGTTNEIIFYDIIEWDKNNCYDIATGIWTAPKDMKIKVNAQIRINIMSANSRVLGLILQNSKTVAYNIETSVSNAHWVAISKTLNVKQGDEIYIKGSHGDSGNKDTGIGTENTYFQIEECIAGTFDPTNLLSGKVELENDEYICDGTENSVTIDVSKFDSDDLEIVFSSILADANSGGYTKITFNSDTGNNYNSIAAYDYSNDTNGGSSFDGLDIGYIRGFDVSQNNSTETSGGEIKIPNFKSNTFKHLIMNSYSGPSEASFDVRGMWKNTEQISSITISLASTGYFIAGSRFKLYGKQTSAHAIVEGNEVTVWQKIRETDITENTTSFEWAGLDGDTDGQYKIISTSINPVANANNITLNFNSDMAQNYTQQHFHSSNSTGSANELLTNGVSVSWMHNYIDYQMFNETLIKAKTGSNRIIQGVKSFDYDSIGDLDTLIQSDCWKNSIDNITTMTITSDQTDGIGIGSHFELWAPRTIKIDPTNNRQIAIFQDVKPQGTSGGTFTQDAWQTRDLNTTQYNDILNCKLENNQITLPKGKYKIEFNCPAHVVGRHIAIFYNITDSKEEIRSTVSYASPSSDGDSLAIGKNIVNINSSKIFELQHICQFTRADGLGISSQWGNAIFSQIEIEKIG